MAGGVCQQSERDHQRARHEIRVTDPRRTEAKPGDPGPRLPLSTIGPNGKVRRLDPLELRTGRLVRYAVELDGALAAPDGERRGRSRPEVRGLTRIAEGVEDELERIRDRVADHGRLRCPFRIDRGNDAETLRPDEAEDFVAMCHGLLVAASREIETIQVHDLGPRSSEVLCELL